MKAMGPQKAVTTAVSNPVMISKAMRRRWTLKPKFSAYCSPKSMAFSGLMRSNEANKPMMAMRVKYPTSFIDTLPKLPIPHTIYDFTPSAVLKKFKSEMALLARYPTMIPMMRSTTWLRTIVEKSVMMPITTMAPAKAEIRMARKPPMV